MCPSSPDATQNKYTATQAACRRRHARQVVFEALHFRFLLV